MSVPLWTPDPARVGRTRLDAFRRSLSGSLAPPLTDSRALWRWSVDEPGQFWRAIWNWTGVVGDAGPVDLRGAEDFWAWRFLPEATLNVVDTLLVERPEADPVAIEAWREDGSRRTMTWTELRADVAAMAAALRDLGVRPGDRVAAWMPNVPETVVTMLAAVTVGATFTSTSSDFGAAGVVDRFGQTEPVVLVAADGYRYGGRRFDCLDRLREIAARLPSLRRILVVGVVKATPRPEGITIAAGWEETLARYRGEALATVPGTFDTPWYILYSSGTTGLPKCIVHRAGGVLVKHLVEHQLHCDVTPGDRVCYFTTCGWMMWNWLVSALGSGATIVLYDGSPFHPGPEALFDLADAADLTLLGLSAKFIDSARKAGVEPVRTHELDSLRTICSTGSPLSHEGFEWVYEAVSPDVHLASISGGTDLCGCLVGGDPTQPVYAGEIQGEAFGMAISVFDDAGRPLGPGEKGELVCTRPFPSMPLGFWNDPGGDRYRSAYFERYPGVWAHGDFAAWTRHGGMVIFGRADATLNPGGVRIGTAELYRQVELLPEIVEAIAVGQEWEGDTRIVLFVHLVDGVQLGDELASTIRARLRDNCSPRHVPAVICEVSDIPRTRSGKIVELAVTDVVHGRPVRNVESLANPEALAQFRDRPELRAGPGR